MATTISTNSPKLTANIADHADVYGGKALVFDGVSDYLDCGDLPFLNSASAFSISVWIKSDNTNSLDYLCNKTTSSTKVLHISIAYNIMYFNVTNGSGSYGTVAFTSTDWNHISLVFNGSGTGNSNRLKAYINGEEQSLTYTGTIPSTTANLSGTAFQIGKYNTDHFDGSIADFKIFDSALTEAQVQELYKKPENTPSAVQDNLVAWYPMIEGNPESPQSIVYDHSEKKLGSELFGDPSFELSGDNADGESTAYFSNVPSGVQITGGQMIVTGSGSKAPRPIPNPPITAGKTYKIVTNVASYSNGAIRFHNNNYSLDAGAFIPSNIGDNVHYFTAQVSSIINRMTITNTNSATAFTLNSISIKEVLMGNHATTNFFGDDLTNGHGAFDVTTNWSVVSGSLGTEWSIGSSKATHATGNTNTLRYSDSSNPMIQGREYRIDFTISGRTAGNLDFAVGGGPASASDFTASGNTTLTAGGSLNRVVDIKPSSDFDGSVDLITVKEVGISSSGFETAVNEPVVPQVPLMRYNQVMLFDGTDDIVDCGDIHGIDGATKLTINAWMKRSQSDSVVTIGKTQSANYRVSINIFHDGNLYVNAGTGSSYAFGSVSLAGTDWNYISYVFDGTQSGNSSRLKVYVNGVAQTLSFSGANIPSSIPPTSATFKIGKDNANNIFSEGCIKDVSVFNEAFSVSEVQEIFNDGVAYDATTHSKADDHLLGYWRNDGVTTWTDRSDIQAIAFNGFDNYIKTTGGTNLLNSGASGSISVWVYAIALDQTSHNSNFQWRYPTIISKGNVHMSLIVTKDGAVLGYYYNSSASNVENIITANSIITTGNWHHIVWTWNASSSKLYVDSTERYSGSYTPYDMNSSGNNSDIYIGHNASSTAGNFAKWNGLISQCAIYNSELSSSDVLSIYNLGRKNVDLTTSYPTNIQGYWFLNPTHSNPDLTGSDKILDRSGNSNHGTQNGGVSFLGANDGDVQGSPDSITIREGLNSNRDGLGFYFTNPDSNVLRLNGVNEYVSVPHTKSLVVSEQLTLECWAKLDRVTPSEDNSMISKYDEAGDTGREYLFQFPTDKRITFRVSSAGSSATLRTLRADNAISDGNLWHHYVATFASGTMKMYVDGSEISATASGATVTSIKQDGTANVVVGCISTSSTPRRFFNGLIDEAKVYNRALSADEINKNYKHQKGKHKND